jgi:hypothetical protein
MIIAPKIRQPQSLWKALTPTLAEEGQIDITQKTSLELHALGYNLYRATSLDTVRDQLNTEIILSKFGC